MNNEKELWKRIESMSQNFLRFIFTHIGLKKENEAILVARYIDEMSIIEMCDKFGYDERTITRKLARARKQLIHIINYEYDFMENDLKNRIKLLIQDDIDEF